MLGTVILPLVVIFGNLTAPMAGGVPQVRLASEECETAMYWSDARQEWSKAPQTLLPCTPAACDPTFCETGVELADGALLCLDTDEVFPAGHWATDDWQEDDEPGDSVHYLTEY